MRILLAIVHYWDPNGDGKHQSLRSDPGPRIQALQQQLLCLRRLGSHQSLLHMADRMVYPANQTLRHDIQIRLITDGEHHVINQLEPAYRPLFEEVVTQPSNGRMLGFEAQNYLASQLDQDFDLYGYLEDDLLIHDPLFFHKVDWFRGLMGEDALLLPQRVELAAAPHLVDRFFIDGPMAEADVRQLVPEPGPIVLADGPGGQVAFEPPLNPHAGCFFLGAGQLRHWMEQSWWLDRDCSFISPLESAATLGIAKSFRLFKPCFSHGAWLELQHWGTSFHSLIVAPPEPSAEDPLVEDSGDGE